MHKNKILILILSTKDKSYDSFKKSIIETWVRNAQKNFDCLFYEGNSTIDKLEGNVLKLACSDSTKDTGKKLFQALNFIEKSNIEYTHIYRTNLSSFIYIYDFINYCNLLPLTYYGGMKHHYFKLNILNRIPTFLQKVFKKIPYITINFASGAGFFLSKDLIIKIINSNKINFNYLDDVMIGNILKYQKITNIPRYDIINTDKAIKNNIAFHVRIKTTNRDHDALLMYDLNKFNHLKEYLLH